LSQPEPSTQSPSEQDSKETLAEAVKVENLSTQESSETPIDAVQEYEAIEHQE
jgi:hypothetical protein